MTISSTGGGGGTSDYSDLTNKPQINSVTLSGNKSLNDLGIQPKGNYLTSETDPVFSASASAGITSSDITNWNNKGTYSKPSGGIPKTDLESAVQTSLGKADTSIQDVKINSTSIISSGIANIATKGTYNANTNKIATMDDVKGIDVGWVRNQNGTVSDYNALYNYIEQGNTNVYWIADGYTYISDSMSIDVSEGVKYINLNFNLYTYEITLDGSTIEYNYYTVPFENINNKVTNISSNSTDTQYPSAKAVYNNEYSIVSNNKFDNTYDEIGKLDVTTGEDLSATTFNRTNFRDLGKTITGNIYVTISETTANFMYVCYYDENKIFLKGRTIWEASAADTYEDYVEGARYFRISVKNTWQGSIYISYVYNGVDTATYEYIKKIFNIDDVKKPLDGKIVVNFGDSIFGKRRPPNDISTYISKLTGGTVYNCGFGGLTAGIHGSQYYDPFALHSLADSIYSGDWSVQDAAITAGAGVIPDYFADTVDILESLDFTKVDMITIAYGTNDWNFGMPMDNSNNNKDLTTYAGALRYSIEKILSVYPNIKIFLCTPIFRVMLDSSYVVTGDSDTATNINGKKLTDFIEKLKEVALEYHLTYIDNYYGLGINIKNWLYYFKNTDGTHPIITGIHLIAEHIAQALMGDYTTPNIKVKSENSTTAGEVYDVTYINTMIGDVETILTTLTTGSGV